jgi:HEAT repeat protein
MPRRCFALLLCALLPLAPAMAGDDEPTFLDQKLSSWIKLLHEGKDVKSRRRGIIALEQIGYAGSRKVIPALAQAVREDKEPAVRAAAARAVGRTAAKALEQARAEKKDDLPRFDSVRDALGNALRTDKSEAVREAAALALGDLAGDARGMVHALAQALKDKHAGTVKAAAQSLRRMGKDARDAQPELQALLADRTADAEARADAAQSLGQIRPDVSQALPVLREVLADEKADARVRRAAADTLGKIGKEAADATPTLAAVLVAKESSPELRLAAVGALDQFGPDAKAALAALVKAAGDPALLKAAGENARFLRCLAMHALGRMGKDLGKERKAAVAAILDAVEDPNVEVSVSAIETLGALGTEGLADEAGPAVKKLDAVLAREGRRSIRDAAQAARDRILGKKKE